MRIEEFVTEYFSKKNTMGLLPENFMDFNYLDSQFLNSLEFIQMVADLEENLQINFEDVHFKDPRFKFIGGLIDIIKKIRSE